MPWPTTGMASKNEGDNGHGSKCTQVHVRGHDRRSDADRHLTDQARKLNLAPGSQVVLQLGAAGQTVSVNAEACSTTTGSTTQLVVKSAELKAKTPKADDSTTTTAPVTTTAPATTTGPLRRSRRQTGGPVLLTERARRATVWRQFRLPPQRSLADKRGGLIGILAGCADVPFVCTSARPNRLNSATPQGRLFL